MWKWKRKKIEVVFCPHCQEDIQETDHIGIRHWYTIVHLYCGAWPPPDELIMEEGTYKQMFKKYL